jgi:EAL domain-containing protein (putative c-di-GMP-specific phosphodiesterase class I)
LLRQIIYQSTAEAGVSEDKLDAISRASQKNNQAKGITGILLFDNVTFFQVLEGEEPAIYETYELIKKDTRHSEIVLITDQVIHKRDFAKWSMSVNKMDQFQNESKSLQNVFELNNESRIFSIINSFASGRWRRAKRSITELKPIEVDASPLIEFEPQYYESCCFAYQPIVDTVLGRSTSVEALLRKDGNTFPEAFINSKSETAMYLFDLYSKSVAIKQVARHLSSEQALSINLLPGVFTAFSNVADFLYEQVKLNDLQPEQLIVEVTETHVIDNFDLFLHRASKLREKGIRIAIDDFGAGYAGLSLLSQFLPDKIKIDRKLITDIHKDGVKQAIVSGVYEFSFALGIPLIAEGVETIEEFVWLSNLGIQRFQGFLFAKPQLQGIPKISWGRLWPKLDDL